MGFWDLNFLDVDMDVEIDNLTVLLLFFLVGLAFYHRFFGPSPDVPPLLLGRQSEVSQVRQPGETAIYRSWATGHGSPLQVRPASGLKTVTDAATVPPYQGRPGTAPPAITQRFILDTPLTNEALTEIVRLVPIGLRALFASQLGTVDSPKSIITLLPPSPGTSLPLLLLSFASQPSNPLVVLPSRDLLPTALTSNDHPAPGLLVLHESCLADAAELDFGDLNGAAILVVGDPERRRANTVANAVKNGINVKFWEEIWDAAESADDGTAKVETTYSDVHSYFYELPTGGAQLARVAKVTHMNMTAGIAGILSLFPANKRPTSADMIGSTVRLDTPFGMAVAVASVWSGAGFRFIGPTEPSFTCASQPAQELTDLCIASEQPLPSILILSPAHHTAVLNRLHDAFLAHPFGSLAARHRLNELQAGHVDRTGFMDKLVWSKIRTDALGGIAGDALRAVAVVGDAPSPTALALSHALLSLPLTRLHATFLSTGPVFVSHFHDMQAPVPDMFSRVLDVERVHSGPPASNVEVLLRGPGTEPADVEKEEGSSIPYEGDVWIRGPGVLDDVRDKTPKPEGWTDTGDVAVVSTNGTFVVLEPASAVLVEKA